LSCGRSHMTTDSASLRLPFRRLGHRSLSGQHGRQQSEERDGGVR
jgi:hypothetical protein